MTIANEAELSTKVVKLAHEYGWKVSRFHRLPTQKGGWRTPVGADGKGFPDLTLVRERTVFAELKMKRNSLRVEQRDWIARLKQAGAEVYVWREDDLTDIERVLKIALPPRRIARLLLATPEDSDLGMTVTDYARKIAEQVA